jgi:ATP-dependent RNA helicase DHR2
MSERPPKKRKLQGGKADPNLVKIGGKFISLEGYLNPKPKPAKSAPPQSEDGIEKSLKKDEGRGNTHNPASKIGRRQDDKTAVTYKPLKQGARSSGSTHCRKENQALLQGRQQLPIWSYRDTIQRAVRENDILILVGETGSGKSTQVPQFLYRESWCRPQIVRKPTSTGEVRELSVGGIIAVTQPRRVAATTLANRVSQEVGTPLGKVAEGLVGYSVRFEHNVPRGAKIKFMTEGMLLQELLNDPNLLRYSAIVVDEIHERSVDVDLLVGFLKQIRTSNFEGRGGIPLKIIIMSATVDVEKIGGFFTPEIKSNADEENLETTDTEAQPQKTFETLHIRGRQYPVHIQHAPKPVPDLQDGMLRAVFKLHTEEPLPGDILVFLTGQEEIEAAQRLLEEYAATLASNVPKIKVLPLFGQLSIEAQHAAFQPVRDKFTRKVVLATNIAETSVTVPGVRFVVDCGKAKVKQFRSRLGMESLLAKPISKSSAIQRAGRAGREGAGKCIRLYTKEGFDSLQDKDLPEILRNDVLGAVLTMKACGIIDVLSFPLLDAPDVETVEKALVQLHLLGAVETHGAITEKGKRMAKFPVSAPFGAVLLAASEPEFDCVLEAIDVISCITSGDDIFQQIQSEEVKEEVELTRKELYRREGDVLTYLTTMQQYTAENTDRIDWCKKRRINARNMRLALKIRKQLRTLCLKEKLLTEPPPTDPQPFVPLSPERADDLLKCFLRGFVTKTAMLHPDGSYVTVQAKHAVAIHPSSVIHGAKREAIMFLEHVFTQKNYAKKVSSIQANWIAEELERS